MSAVSERTMNHDSEKCWRFLSLSEEDNRVARISVDSLEEEEEIARRNCLFGKLLLPVAITTQMVNKDALAQIWEGVDILSITDIGDNVFLFQFATKAEKTWVMENGPWYLEEDRRRTMLVLNTVDGLEKPSGIEFSSTSFWVRFYNIPLVYMSHGCARDLGTQLGFVEDVDVRGDSAPGDSMGKFLRVRIRLNVSKPLRRGISIAFEEGSYPVWVRIRYEKLYHFCFQCGCVDHVVTECSALQGDSSSSTRDDQFGPWLCVDNKDQFIRPWLGTNHDASPCRGGSDNSPSPPKEGSGVAGGKCVNGKTPKPFHIMLRSAYFLVYSLNYLSYRLVAAVEEMLVPPVVVDAEYLKEIDKARQDLRALISSQQCGPLLLRLAWLDALSYDVNSNTGGPNSSIRNDKEYFCLNNAVDLCEKIKYKHPKVTYADLYQLAGVVAIEAIGGPIIDFVPGRKDSKISPRNGIFPDPTKGDKSQLRDIFFHMGLSDKDVVTLSGARHLMATSKRADESSYVGLWTEDQLKFDNSYFTKLLKRESEGSKLHPVDQYLLDDPVFRPYIELYAEDGDIFFRDYAVSHKKLSELGFTPSSTGCLVKKLK